MVTKAARKTGSSTTATRARGRGGTPASQSAVEYGQPEDGASTQTEVEADELTEAEAIVQPQIDVIAAVVAAELRPQLDELVTLVTDGFDEAGPLASLIEKAAVESGERLIAVTQQVAEIDAHLDSGVRYLQERVDSVGEHLANDNAFLTAVVATLTRDQFFWREVRAAVREASAEPVPVVAGPGEAPEVDPAPRDEAMLEVEALRNWVDREGLIAFVEELERYANMLADLPPERFDQFDHDARMRRIRSELVTAIERAKALT